MALEKAGDILREAYRKGYAVAAFNVFNYETIHWAIRAAEMTETPVLIEFYPGWKTFIPLPVIAEITRTLAKEVTVPIGLHLDHCNSLEGLKEALDAGFLSVMYDGSRLAFEDNLANTKEAVAMTRRYGADLEAELGHIGSAGNLSDITDVAHFTDPEAAERLAKETGLSSLAISIGNAHGNYVQSPELDIPRLMEINKRLGVPLVLHGGSGIPGEQVRLAISEGIAKMNVATDYHQAYYQSVELVMKSGEARGHMFSCAEKAEAMTLTFLQEKIRLLRGA